MAAGSVIINHIEYHGNILGMASVNKVFIHFIRTIGFVHGKEEARIIAPTDRYRQTLAQALIQWH